MSNSAKSDSPGNPDQTTGPPISPTPKASASQPSVDLIEGSTSVCYANFCRVTGTPEELILDFGLNSQPTGAPDSLAINQRLVVNFYTAKRMLHALAASVHRHEQIFGNLETDVQKRVRVQN